MKEYLEGSLDTHIREAKHAKEQGSTFFLKLVLNPTYRHANPTYRYSRTITLTSCFSSRLFPSPFHLWACLWHCAYPLEEGCCPWTEPSSLQLQMSSRESETALLRWQREDACWSAKSETALTRFPSAPQVTDPIVIQTTSVQGSSHTQLGLRQLQPPPKRKCGWVVVGVKIVMQVTCTILETSTDLILSENFNWAIASSNQVPRIYKNCY